MIPTTLFDNETRNVYLRYILKMLIETYLINQAKVAHRLGFDPKYLREFVNGTRGRIGDQNLDKIEELIFDLYKPILESELPDNIDDVMKLIEFIKK